jgi:hypothetical protein
MIILTEETYDLRERTVPVPPCPPHIPPGMTRLRTQTSAMRGPATNHLSHGRAYSAFKCFHITPLNKTIEVESGADRDRN